MNPTPQRVLHLRSGEHQVPPFGEAEIAERCAHLLGLNDVAVSVFQALEDFDAFCLHRKTIASGETAISLISVFITFIQALGDLHPGTREKGTFLYFILE